MRNDLQLCIGIVQAFVPVGKGLVKLLTSPAAYLEALGAAPPEREGDSPAFGAPTPGQHGGPAKTASDFSGSPHDYIAESLPKQVFEYIKTLGKLQAVIDDVAEAYKISIEAANQSIFDQVRLSCASLLYGCYVSLCTCTVGMSRWYGGHLEPEIR
jgi:hypothetical protein